MTRVRERTVHHFHDGEVEELLQRPQAQLAVAQQHRPALVNEHVLRQLLLQPRRTGQRRDLKLQEQDGKIIKQGRPFVSADDSHPWFMTKNSQSCCSA